jgi:hypothetical protein
MKRGVQRVAWLARAAAAIDGMTTSPQLRESPETAKCQTGAANRQVSLASVSMLARGKPGDTKMSQSLPTMRTDADSYARATIPA